jgi:hypothetical protein
MREGGNEWYDLADEVYRVAYVATGEGQGPRYDITAAVAQVVSEWHHLTARLAEVERERDEAHAAIGTLRGTVGLGQRNVADLDMPAHTREIGDAFRTLAGIVERVRGLCDKEKQAWSGYDYDCGDPSCGGPSSTPVIEIAESSPPRRAMCREVDNE